MGKSALHFNHWADIKIEKAAFDFGTAFHTAVLEEDKFDSTVAKRPKFDRRTKQGKLDYDKYLEDHKGKLLLDPDDFDAVRRMRDSVYLCHEAVDLLQDTRRELSLKWDYMGRGCKGKIDFLGSDYFGDLKSTLDASERGMQIESKKHKYFHAIGWYQWGLQQLEGEVKTPWMIGVEKKPPYAVGIHEMDQKGIEVAQNETRVWFEQWKWSLEHNEWPTYPIGKIYYKP